MTTDNSISVVPRWRVLSIQTFEIVHFRMVRPNAQRPFVFRASPRAR